MAQRGRQYHPQAILIHLPDPGQVQPQLEEADRVQLHRDVADNPEMQLHEDCHGPHQQTSPGKPSIQLENLDTAYCFTRLKPSDPDLEHEQVQPQLEEADRVQRHQHEDHTQPAQATAHGGQQCLQQTALHHHQEQVQDEPQLQVQLHGPQPQNGRQYHPQAVLTYLPDPGQVQPQLEEAARVQRQQHEEQVQDEPQLQSGRQYHPQAVLIHLPDPGHVQHQLEEADRVQRQQHEEQVQDEPQLQRGCQYHPQAALIHLPDPGQVQLQLEEADIVQLHRDCHSPRQQQEDLTQSGQQTSTGKISYQPQSTDTAICFTRLKPPDHCPHHGQTQGDPQLQNGRQYHPQTALTHLGQVQDPDEHQEQVQGEPQPKEWARSGQGTAR